MSKSLIIYEVDCSMYSSEKSVERLKKAKEAFMEQLEYKKMNVIVIPGNNNQVYKLPL